MLFQPGETKTKSNQRMLQQKVSLKHTKKLVKLPSKKGIYSWIYFTSKKKIQKSQG